MDPAIIIHGRDKSTWIEVSLVGYLKGTSSRTVDQLTESVFVYLCLPIPWRGEVTKRNERSQ
jgi:hypothetical protein